MPPSPGGPRSCCRCISWGACSSCVLGSSASTWARSIKRLKPGPAISSRSALISDPSGCSYERAGGLLMEHTTPERLGRSDRAALVGLTVLTLTVTLLAYSPAAVPLIDDWLYAWSVEHFLQTGAVRILEWSMHYPLAQILWGALFSQLFGFSFAVLRLSPLILAWAGLLAFFLTLREIGIRPLPASLGTLVLLCNPVLFMLSHSFMTDVPFVSVMNGALLYYVRWANRGRTQDLALGSGLATVAFLIRQPGAVIALVPIGYLLLVHLVGGTRRVLLWP